MERSDVWVFTFVFIDLEAMRPAFTLPVKDPAVVSVDCKVSGNLLQLMVDCDPGQKLSAMMTPSMTYVCLWQPQVEIKDHTITMFLQIFMLWL